MTQPILPAILSGGAGARLWPASTEANPKQFHALTGARSLFGETLARLSGQAGGLSFAPPLILGAGGQAEALRRELAKAGARAGAIALEPAARNTAAAAAAAAAIAQELAPDALVLLAPADHVIADAGAFHAAIARAAPFARERIVTFGITPDRPETGYGYIKAGVELGAGVHAIESFREKPDAATAQSYLSAGGYSWNAGIFLFSPAVLLDEFGQSAEGEAIRAAALAAVAHAARRGDEIWLDAAAFSAAPALPLDVAVMEKTARGAVAPCEIGWADVGSWSEIWRLAEKDGAGNAVHGDVVALDSANNLLRGEGVTVCVSGVSDLIVVATPEAVIIVPRERAQDVKALRDAAAKPKP